MAGNPFLGDHEEPPVDEVRNSYLLGGGSEKDWEELVGSPQLPRWASQWMDAGEEGHKEKIFELAKHHLRPEVMLEYEAVWDDGITAGRALVLITKVHNKKNVVGLDCQHLVASDKEYQDWSQEEINKKMSRRLHLCFSQSACRLTAPGNGVHWIHVRAFRVVPFTVAFNQEYCFEVAVAELRRQVAGLVSQMKAQGVPSGVPTPKSAGLAPGGGVPWEEPLPRERARKKKPIQPADVEQQSEVAELPQADAATRAAAKQEANRAALALRSRSPVMIPRKSVATPKQVPEQKHRTREDEKAAKHKGTWLDNIPSDSGRGRGGGPPGDDDDGNSSGDGGGRKGGRRSPSSSDSSGDGDDDDSRDDRRGKVRASLVVPPKKEKKKDKRKKEESRSDRRGKRGRSKERMKKKDKHKDKKERDKKRKRRKQRSSRSSSRSSSSETGSLERLYGKETKKFDTLAEKARKHPGRLLQGGLEEMRKYMLARTGESGTEQSWRQQRVGAYIQQVLFVRHNPSQIGVRNTREILTLSAALDALLEEDFPLVGDLLMQRLKAVESALVEGWNVASHQELIASPNASLTSSKEKSYAARQALQAQRLEESVKKRRSG